MPGIAIVFGVILVLQGIITYFISDADSRSFTAFIPSIFGALLVICGAIGQKPELRKHAMHGAAGVALLGLLGSLGRAIPAVLGGNEIGLAVGSQLTMGILLLIFLVLCVRSFIAARKARGAGIS